MPVSDRVLRRVAPFALLATLGVAACASEPPTAEMASARAAISRAEADGAGQLAPVPLQSAQGRLGQAQTKAQSGNSSDIDHARRLAVESEADANLAAATARAQRAETTATDLSSAHSMLGQRQQPPSQPQPQSR